LNIKLQLKEENEFGFSPDGNGNPRNCGGTEQLGDLNEQQELQLKECRKWCF